MDSAKVHPSELGFELGMSLEVGGRGQVKMLFISDRARERKDIVYVALINDQIALKVGISRHGLHNRWKGIVGVMQLAENDSRLRKNEIADGNRLLSHATGSAVSVWFKGSEKIEIPYAKQITSKKFSARGPEELFLDWYYEPLFGIKLDERVAAPDMPESKCQKC